MALRSHSKSHDDPQTAPSPSPSLPLACLLHGMAGQTGDGRIDPRHLGWLADLADGFVIRGGRLTEYRAPYTDVTVPDGVVSIGRECFADLSVRSVTLPEGLEEIKPRAFAGCRQLREVTLPASLTEIGEEAFSGCRQLHSVILPEGLRLVGRRAFRGCSSLASVTVTFSRIPVGCFAGCLSLSSVTLPETLSSVATDAFRHCVSLEAVWLPNGAKTLAYGGDEIPCESKDAFRGCSSLASVTCDGLTDAIVLSNFRLTPFADRWKEVKGHIDEMRANAPDASDGTSAGKTVMSAIESTISGVIDANSPGQGDTTV